MATLIIIFSCITRFDDLLCLCCTGKKKKSNLLSLFKYILKSLKNSAHNLGLEWRIMSNDVTYQFFGCWFSFAY